jgi:MinD superfamily P-loop ATPase
MKEVVILSGKGGTGKTTVSAAFSTIMNPLVVADCDVDAANLYLTLQPENYKEEKYISSNKAQINQDKCIACGKCIVYCRFGAISYVGNKVEMNQTACEGCELCSKVCPSDAIYFSPEDKSRWYEGVYRNGWMVHARLAPGEENSGRLVSLVRERAKKIAEEKNIDTIILDGHPGIGCPVIASLTGVQKALLITEPTHSGFHDLKRILVLCQNFNISSYVVINKYDLNEEFSDAIENWCVLNAVPCLGKLPFDEKVVTAMVQCKSIIEFDSACEYSRITKNIFEKLMSYE